MKKTAFNPYLPSWEYVPDGEPHVFGDRVYVYGSHDRFGGYMYCLNDYVCWSAPVDNLGDWRYEGVIYKRMQEPKNTDGQGCLYAPDVTQGPDGRYYLYYVISTLSIVSVAVCDEPAGKYEFLGYVQYPDGTKLGEKAGDEPQFDPGVLTEGDTTYLYTGFCGQGDKSRSGAMVTVLGPDMLTIEKPPVIVAPSQPYSSGSGFEGHEFFEAPSIRKKGNVYYFIYSSVKMYELCYATSKSPTSGFKYGGVIISNNDMGIDRGKPADMPIYYGGNNHGSITEINGSWYIFYHRHTNGTNYSRQACAEPIQITDSGRIPQVEMTSCGLNGGPLPGKGRYSAHIACNLFCSKESVYTGSMGGNGLWMDSDYPKITQDGSDDEKPEGYILNMTDSSTAGFKYFSFRDLSEITITVRGYCNGTFEVRTSLEGDALCRIPVGYNNYWADYSAKINIPDGVYPLYISYTGSGSAALAAFTLS